MNRRTFIAALSALTAGAGLPSIGVPSPPRLPIDLTDFTERPWCMSSRRYDLHTPFVQEDWHFATDGRILVRADESAAGVTGASEKRPNCVQICEWLDGTEHELWRPWPAQRWVPDQKKFGMRWCPVCEGRGSVVDAVQCDVCDGEGSVIEFHNDDPDDFTESKCGACNGIGWQHKTPCHSCNGVAECDGMPTIQEIGHNLIQANYDKRIRKLGEVEYLTIHTGVANRKKNTTAGKLSAVADSDVIAFRGHRFIGLLMPIIRA